MKNLGKVQDPKDLVNKEYVDKVKETADSAVQEVDSTGTGLKVSKDPENKTKIIIEIDEDVVFYFDGGTATDVI